LEVLGFRGGDEVGYVDYERVRGEDMSGVEVRWACCVVLGWG
jgi:hypothetical protein